jgi:hypothetical protein
MERGRSRSCDYGPSPVLRAIASISALVCAGGNSARLIWCCRPDRVHEPNRTAEPSGARSVIGVGAGVWT